MPVGSIVVSGKNKKVRIQRTFLFHERSLLFLEKRDYPEQDHCTENGCEQSPEPAAPMNAEPTQNATADDTAGNTDQEVNPKAETTALHDLAGQKTSQAAYQN